MGGKGKVHGGYGGGKGNGKGGQGKGKGKVHGDASTTGVDAAGHFTIMTVNFDSHVKGGELSPRLVLRPGYDRVVPGDER